MNTVDMAGAASEYSLRGTAVPGLTILLYSLLVAVVLGVLFSLAYPRTEVNVGLASLFALAALVIVLTIRAIWQTVRRKKA